MRIITVFPGLLSISILSLVAGGCATIKDANIRQQIMGSNCNQQNIYNYTEEDLPKPLHTLAIEKHLATQLSYGNLNMANAIGILPDLTRYIHLKKNLDTSDLAKRLTILELKQRIDHKINMASLEVSAVASEMDCEEERTSQVANYLKGSENEQNQNLRLRPLLLAPQAPLLPVGSLKTKRPVIQLELPPASPRHHSVC